MADLTAFGQMFRLMMMSNHQDGESDRRGRRPPLPPAHEIRSAHRFANAHLQLQIKANPSDIRFRNTLSNRINSSKNPFSTLKRTSIDQLYLEVSAVGKYVIIRVLEQGYQVVGWNNVVEDDRGNVCGFSVYNYPPQELFPVGTVLILKEPYFKIANQGFQFLRCDCPTDIIVLRPSNPLFHMSKGIEWKHELCEPVDDPLYRSPVPAGADQWKERGNALFNHKQLILAREAYQLGLQNCQQNNPTFKRLQSNLMAVDFNLGYFEKVIKIANDILSQFPNERKALFRAGRAHYELRQYKKALNHFEKLQEFYPNDGEGRSELERAKQRVHEMETGCVSIKKLKNKKTREPTKEIDCADYIGPVKVTDIPGKGRGVVLTEDVEPETILIVSKAFAAVLDPMKSLGMQLGPDKTLESDRNRLEIVTKLAQLMTKNPTTIGPLVYDLSTGVQPREEIMLYCDPQTKEEPICDVEKIKAICTCNNFAIDYQGVGRTGIVGAGLFLFPSYMNHSCVPNVKRTFYNDVMIVRAVQRLKAGDELCTNYVPIAYSFKQRTELFAKRGFTCHCTRCQGRI